MTAVVSREFDIFFRNIVQSTCKAWGYKIPQEDYFTNVYERIPLGLGRIIAMGISSGILNDIGLSKTKSAAFRPVGLSEKKGPYSWFSRDNQNKRPWPNWEYFVQSSEYIRLFESLKTKSVDLKFEDELMDIGIYRNNKLWVCCEIKEKSSQAQYLMRKIKKYEDANDLPIFDRGNDPLRKAKYIVNLKPQFFYLVSIGRRFEFRVDYPEHMQFRLIEDLVPFI